MPRTVKTDKNLQPGQPAKPDNLSAGASQEWDRFISELEAAHIRVTAAHRTPLSLAATIAADIADAWAVVKKDGAYIQTKAGLAAHPASKRLDALRRDYIKILTMLGLRSAVAAPDEEHEQTLEDILGE